MRSKRNVSCVIEPALICFCLVVASNAAASDPNSENFPAKERPSLPSFTLPPNDGENILPAIPLPQVPDAGALAGGQRLFVRGYRYTGNTVLSDAELNDIAEPYLNREITFTELISLRDAVTRAYVVRGYLNSGATVPPQSATDGIVDIQIVEGRLSDIDYQTDGRLKQSYVLSRVRRHSVDPLNVYQLERYLQFLQQDERIDHIQAQLIPTAERGESNLSLTVVEARPYNVSLQLDNYESPSVGAEAASINASHNNLSGYGDRLEAGYRRTRGLWSVNGRYEVPLSSRETLLDVHGQHTESEVIEKNFRSLDVKSESVTYGFTLRQPLTQSIEQSSSVYLTAQARHSTSFLLGEPFSFSPGVEAGKSKVSVLRLGYQRSYRSRANVLALRSQLSVGLNVLGATEHVGDVPDSQFQSLLLQAQWARRFDFLSARLLARADAQFSDAALLGMEQFSLGGHATIRGYRENTLVRDQGWVASMEIRVPVTKLSRHDNAFEVGIFVDTGRVWNKVTDQDGQDRLSAVGVGLHWLIIKNVSAQLEWAKRLENVPPSSEYDFQDDGLHLRLSAWY